MTTTDPIRVLLAAQQSRNAEKLEALFGKAGSAAKDQAREPTGLETAARALLETERERQNQHLERFFGRS